MNRKRNILEQRRASLLDMIRQSGDQTLDVEQVSALLGVSPVTLRRDLVVLQEQGLITHTYGKVFLTEDGEPAKAEVSSDIITRIAKRAAKFVENGDTIFLNTSSTVLRMLKYIEASNVTVITNNVLAVNSPHRNDLSIILTGGEVRYPKYAMVGDFAMRTLQSINANKCFVGCNGVSFEYGMTTENSNEVSINTHMLTQSTSPVYLLADHSKIGKNSNFTSGDIRSIALLITDRTSNPEVLEQFRAIGMQIFLV